MVMIVMVLMMVLLMTMLLLMMVASMTKNDGDDVYDADATSGENDDDKP